jgi:hypothetical protein
MIQRIEREVSLGELSLPQTGTEGVDGVVSAGDVFREVEMGQQLGARHGGRRLRFLVTGASDGSLGALSESLIYGLTQCQRILRIGSRCSDAKEERKAQSSIQARNHWMKCPSLMRS